MVITISRETESGGDEVARLISERAGIQVADRTILERIAQHEGMPATHLSLFDDAVPGPIEALIAEWRTSVSQVIYLRRLVRVLILLEREDNMVILGRGAAFVLTDPGTLHARVVAPMPCRIARLVERQGVSQAEAERMIRRRDGERARFVRQAFGVDCESPTHYDLTVNTAELPLEEAAEALAAAARRKATRRRIAVETPEDFLSHLSRFRRRPRFPRVSEVTWERCRRRIS